MVSSNRSGSLSQPSSKSMPSSVAVSFMSIGSGVSRVGSKVKKSLIPISLISGTYSGTSRSAIGDSSGFGCPFECRLGKVSCNLIENVGPTSGHMGEEKLREGETGSCSHHYAGL